MVAILLSAAVTSFVALFLGAAALRLAGAREWNWLAPAVGLSLTMVIASSTTAIPGEVTTMAVLLTCLTIAAAVWCLRSDEHRPPLGDLIAVLPVLFLTLVPFLAVGRGGILGVTVDNDMAVHLKIVESFLSPAAAAVYPLPSDYPLGPHASVAILSRGLGVSSAFAFSGWMLAVPLINGWTVLAAARRANWLGKAGAATVTGMPFLVAAYYGEGSFKEVAQAGLVMAVALQLAGCGPSLGRARWVTFAILVGGVISVYSPAGLAWIAMLVSLWLAGLLAATVWRRRLGEARQALRRELPSIGVGVAVLLAVLLPQAGRMWNFIALREGTGIETSNIGNLIGRLPGWEALGVWGNADFRLPTGHAFTGGVWSWLVLALFVFGSYWAFRRGRWMLPLAAGGSLLIWKYSDRSQSIYVTAKALVIASPLVLLVATFPFLDPPSGWRSRGFRLSWMLVPVLGLVLFFKVFQADIRAMRFSPVGPTEHADQLIEFRPMIQGEKTLFLGQDEFSIWSLAGSELASVPFGPSPGMPSRPQKRWDPSRPADFDTFPAEVLNRFQWFITSRSVSTSAPPTGIRLVRSSESFMLWRKAGRIPERSILNEGDWAGAVLDCDTKRGRSLVRRGGVAAVRKPPVVVPVELLAPGDKTVVTLRLPAGKWQIEAPYTSPLPVEVEGSGFKRTLPANLERAGPRFPIGRVTLSGPASVKIALHLEDTLLAPDTAVASFGALIAAPAEAGDRLVPIKSACGRYVDWYRSPGP